MRKSRKPKTVNYELIVRDSEIGQPIYALLDELVLDHHEDLTKARIALAWCTSWKADLDGRVTRCQCWVRWSEARNAWNEDSAA